MNAPARVMDTPADLTLLRQLVDEDLAKVNQVILTQSHSEIALVNELASHIIASGGKRLRPCITLATSKLCGYTGERHVNLAACVEFIHTATLLHDDVVDASDLRRGSATANALWGNKTSVLVGDFLFSRAFQLMVADGSLDVLKILSDASAIISAGEVHQLMVSHDLSITQEVYEAVISAKTAALFAAASEVGAIVSDKLQQREALRDYGQALGMAFQIADDTLDYQASEEELGKSIGDDFKEGKVTLPVIVAYAAANAEEKSFWQAALDAKESLSVESLKRARELMLKHDAFRFSLQVAQTYAAKACDALSIFPESKAKLALTHAANFAAYRSY